MKLIAAEAPDSNDRPSGRPKSRAFCNARQRPSPLPGVRRSGRKLEAYSPGRFLSYDQPKIPLRCTSGSGAGTSLVSACGGGGGGAGKFSHFIEYTSLPSSVRPIGAQLSTRAVAPLGNNFVCAHAGDAIKRMANTSFFIGFSRETCTVRPLLKRIVWQKSTGVVGFVSLFTC
jgi:hypothetical protein